MKNRLKKHRYNAKTKEGISLIVLILTIVVALILVATVAVSTTISIDNANITTFAKDVTEIQEATESYYITNNVMPSFSDSVAMNKDAILAIARNPNLLTEELTLNSDLESTFYTIDLSKINVTKTAYGNKEAGANDIFVISFPSMNAYYLRGIDAKGTTYYSITSKISSITKIAQNVVDNSTTTVITSGGIKVTKTNGWANKMGVSIEADMAVDEILYMSVSGYTNRIITTTTGRNTFGFDLLSSIVSNTETIKVPDLTLVEANYIEADSIELGAKPTAEKYVDILKYKNGEVIGKVRIDLSNFSKTLPTITGATLSSYSSMNTVKLTLANTVSGIKEVRYEYLSKYTEDGTITNYYTDITDFDLVYMKDKAKKAKLANDLTTTINAPKNVQSIRVAVIDKAGNINLYNQEIAPRLYIGYEINSFTQDSLQVTANMFSTNGIKSITFSKSMDGINYTDEQVYTLNTTTNGVTTQQCTPYANFTVDNAYIKMVAINYDSTITETRTVKVSFDIPMVSVNEVATVNSTINGRSATYNNPIIPVGFKAINTDGASWNNLSTDWNKGLVIQDTSGNQFVWVPVDGTNVTYAKWCTTGISNTLTTDDTLPSGYNVANITSTYKGFYIARYESSFDYNSGSIRVASRVSTNKTSSTNWSTTRNITYNGYLWNFINYTDAKTYAESMASSYGYDTSKVGTNLVTGVEWDTTLKWIQNSGISVTDSRTWGNYSNSISPANISGYNSLQISGYSNYWKAKNIYDLAGNTMEWTNEVYSSDRISRGGDYSGSGSSYPATFRGQNGTNVDANNVSFRVALYIL